ncbi:DUF659 domain-containing protein [Aphis craccivora]|uniref:DUF659 domain-containing protein n=1 Tax=Aphis craccivora TaxID=307492 RepID=A0A6G0YVP9_APHCR|nr:DUF659 domain-containing protein [Aphis craccivora]
MKSEGNNDDKVLLILSDAAPYMTKAAHNLKLFYSNLVHVTCVAHGIHRIAEKIIDTFSDINDLINNGKKVLKEISKILQGDSDNFNDLSVPNYSPDILANFKYAPITSVDVE